MLSVLWYCDDNVGYCVVKKGRVPIVTVRWCYNDGVNVSKQ